MDNFQGELVLESFATGGVTTPILVRELLHSRGVDISKATVGIECEKCSGWLWLIYARNIYVWNFKDKTAFCYELPLPSSGLLHSARLCYVFPLPDDDITKPPSCICISPEGCVRYWPKANQQDVYFDYNVELSGQVGHSVTPLKGKRFESTVILSTTTCSLFLISISNARSKAGQPVQCTPLKTPQTLLSSLGRRISSFILPTGFSASQDALVNVVVTTKKGPRSVSLCYVLNSKCQLQCWQLEPQENKLIYESDIREILEGTFGSHMLDISVTDETVKVLPVDFVLTGRRHFAILAAVIDVNISRDIRYGVALFNINNHELGKCVEFFQLPFRRNLEPYLEDIEAHGFRLLCPFTYDGVLVHDRTTIAMSHEDQKMISNLALAGNDQILGADVQGDQFLVFTSSKGLQTATISIGRIRLPYVAELEDQTFQLHQITKSEDELEYMTTQDYDRPTRFKAAFIYFLKQNLAECESLLEELDNDDSDDLDSLAVGLAKDILDDYPASDPRWMEALDRHAATDGGTATRQKARARLTDGKSLLLFCQLDDKRKTMEMFLRFLKSMKLKERLNNYHLPDGTTAPTMITLCGLGERLEACTAFVRKVEEYPKMLDSLLRKIMTKIVMERGESVGKFLSVQDVFYRKVSSFHDFLPVLMDEMLTTIDRSLKRGGDELRRDQNLMALVGDLIMVILDASPKYRRFFERSLYWQCPDLMKTWLNTVSMRHALERYYRQTAEFLSMAETPDEDYALTRQCCDMADLILAECLIAPDMHLFEADLRRHLIGSLIKYERYDQARYLAEKYRDFGLMITICEQLDGYTLLQDFKTRYRTDGFLESLYDYYIENGMPGKILRDQKLVSDVELAASTSRYLDSTGRLDLKWILNCKLNDFGKASVDLLTLSSMEKTSVDKKKTYLSLAKLSALALDGQDESHCLKNANEGLIVVDHQKRIPAVAEQPPLSAEEVIEAYISQGDSKEYNLIQAVEILSSVCINKMPKEEYIALRTRIWAEAILSDDWTTVLENDDVMGAATDTVFSRTIKMLFDLHSKNRTKLADQLATADELLRSRELEGYADNPKFRYVLSVGEEQVRSWMMQETDLDDMNDLLEDSMIENNIYID